MQQLAELAGQPDHHRPHQRQQDVGKRIGDRVIEDGYDVGIVTGFIKPSQDLIDRPIGTHSLVVCAASSYLAEQGVPRTPAQLALHAFIGLPAEQPTTWYFTGPGPRTEEIALQPVYSVNSAMMVRLGALAGMGIAILPWQMVVEDLAAGTLTRVMDDYRVDDPDVKVSIVYPNRQFLPAKTRTFVEHTIEHFGRTLSGEGQGQGQDNGAGDVRMPAGMQTPPLPAGEMSTSLHAPRDA
jgi:DNA-binding transcriptional LysR family regulator